MASEFKSKPSGNPLTSSVPVPSTAFPINSQFSNTNGLRNFKLLSLIKSKIDFNELYLNIKNSEYPVFAILQDIEEDNGRAAIIGDVMAHMGKALGAVGMVAGGSVRDIPGIKKADMPVWGTGRVPGHGPFNLIETQTQIEVAKLVIDPGDLIIGDEDGLTRIPLDIAEDTLIKCKVVREKEAKLMSKEGLKEKFDLY